MISIEFRDGRTLKTKSDKGSELKDPFGSIYLRCMKDTPYPMLNLTEGGGCAIWERDPNSHSVIDKVYMCSCGHFCADVLWRKDWYTDLDENRKFRCCKCTEWKSHTQRCKMCRIEMTKLEFNVHVELWKNETSHMSSANAIHNNQHYQEIIKAGPKVIPFIIEELRAHSGFWFLALRKLTGDDPVKPEDKGYMDKMRRAWLNLAKEKKWDSIGES